MDGMTRDEVYDVLQTFARTPRMNGDLRVDLDSYCSPNFSDYVYELEDLGELIGEYSSPSEVPDIMEGYEEESIKALDSVLIYIDNGSSNSTVHINHPVELELTWYLVTEDEEEECILEFDFLYAENDVETCRVRLDEYLVVDDD